MIRTIFVSENNFITFPIPNNYIGKKLEIIIFPLTEPVMASPGKKTKDVDLSFGAWADMDKSTEEICAQIRSSRTFRKSNVVL